MRITLLFLLLWVDAVQSRNPLENGSIWNSTTGSSVAKALQPTCVRAAPIIANRATMVDVCLKNQVSEVTFPLLASYSTRFIKDETLALSVVASAWQLSEKKIQGCHFILVAPDNRSPFIANVIRLGAASSQPVLFVNMAAQESTEIDRLLNGFWGRQTFTCTTVMADLTTNKDEDVILRFLDEFKLYERPHVSVFIVGHRRRAEIVLADLAFRNTLNILYLGIQEDVLAKPKYTDEFFFRDLNHFTAFCLRHIPVGERVHLYTRCLFCNRGRPRVLVLASWQLRSGEPLQHFEQLYKGAEGPKNLHGYPMVFTSVAYAPYVDYIQSKDGAGGVVRLKDSLDVRLIQAFSKCMNFSFVVRSPTDMSFGHRLPNGSWTGNIGAVDRGIADISLTIAIAVERLLVIEYEKTTPMDELIIVSLKPQPLPRYLVFFRPFTMDVWLYLLVTIVIWGIALWSLQVTRGHLFGGKAMTFNSAIFYSWAVVLEDPPFQHPKDLTSQMLVGWWLITCLLITTFLKSSLVAHLAVEGQTLPIDTYQDLVSQKNWKWGVDFQLTTGQVVPYFVKNIDPDARYVYKVNQPSHAEEGLERVLKGRFSFIGTRNRLATIIGTHYVDDYGDTPFYMGKKGYILAPAIGWGVRRGAPFRPQISKLIAQLEEGGVINYWMKDIVSSMIRKARAAKRLKEKRNTTGSGEDAKVKQRKEDGNTRVLRMVHMMGVFLIIVLGMFLATCVFLVEICLLKPSCSLPGDFPLPFKTSKSKTLL